MCVQYSTLSLVPLAQHQPNSHMLHEWISPVPGVTSAAFQHNSTQPQYPGQIWKPNMAGELANVWSSDAKAPDCTNNQLQLDSLPGIFTINEHVQGDWQPVLLGRCTVSRQRAPLGQIWMKIFFGFWIASWHKTGRDWWSSSTNISSRRQMAGGVRDMENNFFCCLFFVSEVEEKIFA